QRTGLQSEANVDLFPWWNEAGNASVTPNTLPGRLDLGSTKLAHTTTGTVRDPARAAGFGAVNVFGIEAQPFITEVGVLNMYTDAPTSARGDDEASGDPVGGPYTHQITIDGSLGGPDNLG